MQDIISFLHNHSLLSLAFALVFILLVAVEFLRIKRGTNQLSPAQLITLINHHNAIVVDVRTPEAFANGHIVDAVSLPFADIDSKYKKLEKFKSQPIVILCALGNDAPRAAVSLAKLGFEVKILAGGLRAWQMAEMPLVKG